MPTEMKKTAPKRSLTGAITCSMRSANIVPARIEPITKAPSSSENPHITEKAAIMKQSPIATTRSVSELR